MTYTLTANYSSYGLSGQASGLRRGAKLPANLGVYKYKPFVSVLRSGATSTPRHGSLHGLGGN